MTAVTLSEEDIPFEEQLQRTPYDFKLWWKYIQIKIRMYNNNNNKDISGATSRLIQIFSLFERALALLPGSYKLWNTYIEMRIEKIRHVRVTSPAYEQVNNVFERALVHMYLMPRMWLNYTKILFRQGLISKTRKTYDLALIKLPVTQHGRIWKEYLNFVKQSKCQLTAVSVYKRYLKFTPAAREDFLDMLQEIGNWKEAIYQLYDMVTDKAYLSPRGTSKEGMWLSIGDICSKYAEKLANSNNNEIQPITMLKEGIESSENNKGRLWCSLANYHSRLGNFEEAEKIYENACKTVVTAKDFSIVYDSYIKLEETIISAELDFADEDEDDDDEEEEDEEGIDAKMDRLENLLNRRETMLNKVLIRRNKQDVSEWEKRVELCLEEDGEDTKIVQNALNIYEEAIKTIDPTDAINGRLSGIYISYSKLFEENNDVNKANNVLERGRNINYRIVDELATVWCANVELLLRAKKFEEALVLIEEAITPVTGSNIKKKGNSKKRDREEASSEDDGVNKIPYCRKQLHQNQKVWNLYLDLEENLRTIDAVRAAYERVISLRVASPQTILNYAAFLEENKYFEESFRAFEKGISLFSFPHALPIWKMYLTKFVNRYKGAKLERARDLFEECCETVPSNLAKDIFFTYAKFETEYGLARHAMSVYDRATEYVIEEDQYDVYCTYIKEAEQLFGAPRTRSIYQKALEALSNKHIPEISIQFSEMEIALNEIDRARAILAHGSQVCDPRIKKSFWQHWKNFEVQHGNEETFKEMLRIQRSVKASYLSSHYLENPDEMDDSEDVNDNFNSNNNNDNIQLNSNNGVGVELNPELNPNMMMSTYDTTNEVTTTSIAANNNGTNTGNINNSGLGLGFVAAQQTNVDDDAEIDIDEYEEEEEDDGDDEAVAGGGVGALAMFQKANNSKKQE